VRQRARAASDRADNGVGHCGRTHGRNHPPALVGVQGGFSVAVIKHLPESYGFKGEYLLRGSLTNLSLARFRQKIALRSGGWLGVWDESIASALRLGGDGTAGEKPLKSCVICESHLLGQSILNAERP
jgi:hypothetical protein